MAKYNDDDNPWYDIDILIQAPIFSDFEFGLRAYTFNDMLRDIEIKMQADFGSSIKICYRTTQAEGDIIKCTRSDATHIANKNLQKITDIVACYRSRYKNKI